MKQALYLVFSSLFMALPFAPRDVGAATLSFSWNRNAETNIAGYRLYYGPLNDIPQVFQAGSATGATLSNLTSGIQYQFYVTAYNTSGLESAPSTSLNYTIPVTTTADTDGDGLPDSYETANGLNPYSASDATQDPDGDGISNLMEYALGSNPRDGQSGLRIMAITPVAGGIAIDFTSISGKIYSLQANDTFPTGTWRQVGSSITGTGATLRLTDPDITAGVQRMYRIVTTLASGGMIISQAAGYQKATLRGSSDTIMSMPFFRPSVFQGTLFSASGSTLVLNGARWVTNQFAYVSGVQSNTYIAVFRGGTREGESFIVTGNTANSLTIQSYGDTLAGINPGDPISIHPLWTLGTIFPGGQGVMTSYSTTAHGTEILLPNLSAPGINTGIEHTYYFYAGAWREVGQGTTVQNDDVILSDMYFWVRQNGSVSTQVLLRGAALTTKWRAPIFRSTSGKQDNIYSLPRPVAATLKQSGLIESSAFRSSISLTDHVDELLVFDNNTIGFNKAPVATYFYYYGAWRKVGSTVDVGNDLALVPGMGFIIRSGTGSNATWVNSPNY